MDPGLANENRREMSINNLEQIQLTERDEGLAMEEPEMPNPLDALNNQLSKKMSKQERDE